MIEQRNTIIQGDALEVLKTLPDGIVQTCVTSPPYYGLRDYGTAEWAGGNSECDHIERIFKQSEHSTLERHGTDGRSPYLNAQPGIPYKDTCRKCGATRIDQQIGLEDTPEAYIARLVEVFREVRRVLRPDGTAWINCGDSFAGSGKGGQSEDKRSENWQPIYANKGLTPRGYKPKDLMLIPFRLALALQDDGWWIRQTIIWHKPNCMPESVEDRPTTAHEYIFLLSKSANYYYDNDAIREPHADVPHTRGIVKGLGRDDLGKGKGSAWASFADGTIKPTFHNPLGRNKRSVWTVSTMPYSEAHFATFPPKLIEPCILAGTSPRACEHCGAPWERVTEATGHINKREIAHVPRNEPTKIDSTGWAPMKRATDAWQPTCSHTNEGTAQCIVLDPFIGTGTVALVSTCHSRSYIGIELNPQYVEMARKRIHTIQPDLWSTSAAEVLSIVRERLAEVTPEEADELLDTLDALIEEKGGVA